MAEPPVWVNYNYWQIFKKKYASQEGRYPPVLPQIAPEKINPKNLQSNPNYLLWKKQVDEYWKFLVFLQNPALWQAPKNFTIDNLILYSSDKKKLSDLYNVQDSGFCLVYSDNTLVSRVGYAFITKAIPQDKIEKLTQKISFARVNYKPEIETIFQQYAYDIKNVGAAIQNPYSVQGYDIGFFTKQWSAGGVDWEEQLVKILKKTRKENSYHSESAPLYFEEDISNRKKYSTL